MGKVYEAEERLSRRRVALKVLRPELGRSEEARRRFLDEMNILAHLDHPNIVRSLASTEVDGELVMALEFLDGETLRQRLATRGRLPWSEAVAITSAVAAALTAAHGQEPAIIHRDLKPENLMLTATGVKVMDFGIGKVLQAMRKGTTGSVGTLAYMSPEQIDAAPVDHRADLYALGLVLYEMLAGRPPFASESPRQLLEMQCTAPPPPLPDEARAGLPRGIERLLARLLAKAPAERPASAHEVIAALEPFATAEGAAGVGAGASVSLAASPTAAVTGPTPTPAPASITAAGSRPDLPVASAPAVAPRLDTIALIDRASGPRQIGTRRAIGIVIALCLATGLATYLVRTRWSASARAPSDPAAAPATTGTTTGFEAAGSSTEPGATRP